MSFRQTSMTGAVVMAASLLPYGEAFPSKRELPSSFQDRVQRCQTRAAPSVPRKKRRAKWLRPRS
jgi:hypothetical protein